MLYSYTNNKIMLYNYSFVAVADSSTEKPCVIHICQKAAEKLSRFHRTSLNLEKALIEGDGELDLTHPLSDSESELSVLVPIERKEAVEFTFSVPPPPPPSPGMR